MTISKSLLERVLTALIHTPAGINSGIVRTTIEKEKPIEVEPFLGVKRNV